MSDRVVLVSSNLLAQELEEVVEWHKLGIYLELSEKELKEIEIDNRESVSSRRAAMLDKWTRKQSNASWEMVIEALEKMSELRLASRLREKYCRTQHHTEHRDEKPSEKTLKSEEQAEVTEMEKVLKLDRKDAVAQEIEILEENYLKVVTSTECAVENTKPTAKKIKRFSQFYMKDEVTSVEELFDQMKPFYFIDYILLEKMVKFFLEQDCSVNSKLDEYIHQLNEFKSSTTVQRFMESIETAQRPLTTADSSKKTTVIIQLVGGWLEKTISDLEKLLEVLFQDKASVLSHLRVSPGSVIITYLTPLSEVDGLIMIALGQVPFMLQVGVCELMIGDAAVVARTQSDTDFSFKVALIKAVQDNNIDVLSFLLDINTSPDAADDNGQTALWFGSFYGRSKAVGFLLKANAKPNLYRDDRVTPLLIASQNGHTDIVSLLLEANANPNLPKGNGMTPLFKASEKEHTDIVSLLLKANANPNLYTDDGVTPLYMASLKGYSGIVSLLLKTNADPNLHTNDGVTPLLVASLKGHTDVVSLLLKANANPNLPKDNTPLSIASQEGHSDIVSLLLKGNANPNLHAYNCATPLMAACSFNHPEVVQLLLASEADPNVLNSDGISALMFACHSGCLESVELLLIYGADPSLQAHGGLTALDLAASNGCEDIVDLIHAVELSQSSSTSPVLTASEIASNVDNETLNILNKAIEKMLVEKTDSLISNQYKTLDTSLIQ